MVLYEKTYFFFSIFLFFSFLSCASRRAIYNNRGGAYRVREDITRLEDEQQNITDGLTELDDASKKINENAKKEGSYNKFIKSGDRGEAEKIDRIIAIIFLAAIFIIFLTAYIELPYLIEKSI